MEQRVNRRGFLGLVFGAVAAPIRKLLPAAPIPIPATVAKPALTLAMLNEAYQNLSYGNSEPDLIVCSPSVYSAIIGRLSVGERYYGQAPGTPLGGIMFNGASIIASKHAPDDEIRLINTKNPDPRLNGYFSLLQK